MSEKDYWSTSTDLRCDAFLETMTWNRSFELKSFLHAADNHSLSDSRMAKVEPLHNLLNQKFQSYGIFHEDLNIKVPNQLDLVISFGFLQVLLDYPAM